MDVYDHSHQQSRRRLAYDHHDGDDDDTVIIGKKGANKNTIQEVYFSLHGFTSLIIDVFKRSASSLQYFRDGRPLTTGFVLSHEPVAEDRW